VLWEELDNLLCEAVLSADIGEGTNHV
jgi:hypothetical protein